MTMRIEYEITCRHPDHPFTFEAHDKPACPVCHGKGHYVMTAKAVAVIDVGGKRTAVCQEHA